MKKIIILLLVVTLSNCSPYKQKWRKKLNQTEKL